MAGVDVSKYAHSPVHKAVATRDYVGLRKILAGLPRLCNPAEIQTESASVAEEVKADAISAVIDRRDVPNRETPLHLAVKLGDETAAEMLMVAGVDWSLQNEQGWSALQEAICNREEAIAMTIVRHYQPLAWAKWCRRLPRLIGTMHRMRDFYMEITFHFESSVIPFISRIAPSDTYKIWKRGANLRADMTLAGFDGFRIQRLDQSILFLGDGSEDGKVPPGSLCMITHKDKEVMNALDGAGAPATDDEVKQEVNAMSQTNIFRPGIDVTQAVLLPQLTWRRQEKSELVGQWKAKVYDMHNVVVSIKSRRVPGAMSDDEFFASSNENETESEELNDILTEEERRQLELALKLDSSELSSENGDGMVAHRHSSYDHRDIPIEDGNDFRNGETKQEKKGWFGGWRKRDQKVEGQKKIVPPRSSLCVEEKVAIPVVPTIRVLVTFTKFEELQPLEEFATPPSSPCPALGGRESPGMTQSASSSSWFQWIKAPYQRANSSNGCPSSRIETTQDPFVIPPDYTWVTAEAKKKKAQEKNKLKKARGGQS
ncbi:unnamed protein product [Linum tenue]|uniref:Ankyrin repeat domain-containing protein n=1 Tax=Linum tenue TaxID=586396 RepID=A0AAV0LRI4_9ROSI|nr:unnamed protein product [Linum tenue]